MRKIMLLAAMLIAPGVAAEPAEAGGLGYGHHQFAPPAFNHHRYVRPPHFGHRGSVAVFRFDNSRFGFRHSRPTFVRPPHFRPPHVWRHHQRAPVLTFGRPPHAKPWGGFQTRHGAWHGRPHHRR